MLDSDILTQVHDDLSAVVVHLVPFLKAQQQVGSLQDRIRDLEQAKANRMERPLVVAIARALSQLRHLPIDPVTREAIEGELVRGLAGVGCVEFGTVGDPFDPLLHEPVAGDGTGMTVTAVHRHGVSCHGDVLVQAQVEVGSIDSSLNILPGTDPVDEGAIHG